MKNIRFRLIFNYLLRKFILCEKDVCLYINGPETLPPPLTPEEEKYALSVMHTDEAYKSLLIEHNLRLVVYIAKKFENTGTNIEDLISIGTIGLIKAINSFNADKNIKLATYASRCIENEILMYIRKNANANNNISIEEPLSVDWDGNELLLSDVLGNEEDGVAYNMEINEEKEAVRKAVSSLCDRERRIIELRYGLKNGNEMTQKDVADYLGISQSYISRIEKKILRKLKDDISQLI